MKRVEYTKIAFNSDDELIQLVINRKISSRFYLQIRQMEQLD
jgi:hypothetical protein